MNSFPDLKKQAVIMELVAKLRAENNWCGQTMVQKGSYFIEMLSNKALGFDFILYKHGPYSFDLADTMGQMDSLGYLHFEIVDPQYGPRMKPDADGYKLLMGKYGSLVSELKELIAFVAKELADCGVSSVERLATALYFTKQEPIGPKLKRIESIRKVKPHITQEQASQAIDTVEDMLARWAALPKTQRDKATNVRV